MIKFLIIILCFCGFLFSMGVYAQVDKLKQQKEKNEKEITKLNKLLDETRNTKSRSTSMLKLIVMQIEQTQELIEVLQEETAIYDNQISSNYKQIVRLTEERDKMLEFYANLIYSMWKNDRNKIDNLMFILSSSDYNQAYKRYKYSEQIRNYSKKQVNRINQMNDSLEMKNLQLNKLVVEKNKIVADMVTKKSVLQEQQDEQNKLISEIKFKEKDIVKQLNKQKKQREELNKQINRLIAEQAKKSSGSANNLKLTPDEKLLSSDFSKNKGKLPWPVIQGVVTEKFGINVHPVHKRVQIDNMGISITTTKNAEVRSVFEGTIASIALIPGLNNVVIVKHGNYFTVYTNLIEVSVKQNQRVQTKDIIGKVANDDENGSILNFQVWQESKNMNPELWLSK